MSTDRVSQQPFHYQNIIPQSTRCRDSQQPMMFSERTYEYTNQPRSQMATHRNQQHEPLSPKIIQPSSHLASDFHHPVDISYVTSSSRNNKENQLTQILNQTLDNSGNFMHTTYDTSFHNYSSFLSKQNSTTATYSEDKHRRKSHGSPTHSKSINSKLNQSMGSLGNTHNLSKKPKLSTSAFLSTRKSADVIENQEILKFSKEATINGHLKIDINSKQIFKRQEVLQLLSFFLSNFKPQAERPPTLDVMTKVRVLKNNLEQLECTVGRQSYNMIMFLDLYKELESMKYQNASVYKILANYPTCESIDLSLDDISDKLRHCKKISSDILTAHTESKCDQEGSEFKSVDRGDSSMRSQSKGKKNFKEQLKKGSINMYQYLTTSTPRATTQSNLFAKSPRAAPQNQQQTQQIQSLLKEVKDKNDKIQSLSSVIASLKQQIDNQSAQIDTFQQTFEQMKCQNSAYMVEEYKKEISSLLIEQSNLLTKVQQLQEDNGLLRQLASSQPQVQHLERLIQMLSNYLISKKFYSQSPRAASQVVEQQPFTENDKQLLSFLFGDLSNYNKLKQKYRNQTKKYLKELRSEQENFLTIYKYLTATISKIQQLRDLVQLLSANQSDGTRTLRSLGDFIHRHFSNAEQELENLKLKIMIKEKKKRKGSSRTQSGERVKSRNGMQTIVSTLSIQSTLQPIVTHSIESDNLQELSVSQDDRDCKLEREIDEMCYGISCPPRESYDDEDLREGVQTPPLYGDDACTQVYEGNMTSTFSTPMFNRNH